MEPIVVRPLGGMYGIYVEETLRPDLWEQVIASACWAAVNGHGHNWAVRFSDPQGRFYLLDMDEHWQNSRLLLMQLESLGEQPEWTPHIWFELLEP